MKGSRIVSSSSSGASSGGIGFFGALTILFIGLKLGGVINWFWISFAVLMVILACVAALFLIAAVTNK